MVGLYFVSVKRNSSGTIVPPEFVVAYGDGVCVSCRRSDGLRLGGRLLLRLPQPEQFQLPHHLALLCGLVFFRYT